MSDDPDRRSVVTDALATLGQILPPGEGHRDAVHIAVEPVIAGRFMHSGDAVFIGQDGRAWNDDGDGHIGIVDPFLTTPVQEGQRFWLFLYPRSVTSLRHVWDHPELPPSNPETGMAAHEAYYVARTWLFAWSENLGSNYEEVMRHAADYIKTGDRWQGDFSDYVEPEFWDHCETVTGTKVDESDRGHFIYCCL